MTEYCSLQYDCELIQDLQNKLDITSRQYEALQKKYCEVLKLAKENADSYEYCLKNLEEKIAELQNNQERVENA